MNKVDASAIVESLISSICENPDQFHIHVEYVG